MRRFAIAIVAATLLIGLAGGVARAATSASPSPGGDKVVLRIGTLQEVASTRSPAINIHVPTRSITSTTTCWSATLRTGTSGRRSPTAGRCRDDGLTWTFKIHPGHHAGRTASRSPPSDVAFTFNYIIDNELSAFTDGYPLTSRRPWPSTTRRSSSTCSKPKANMLRHVDPDPARAHLVRRCRGKRPPTRSRTSRR